MANIAETVNKYSGRFALLMGTAAGTALGTDHNEISAYLGLATATALVGKIISEVRLSRKQGMILDSFRSIAYSWGAFFATYYASS